MVCHGRDTLVFNNVRKMHMIHCVAFKPSQQVQATQWFELQLLYLSLFGPIRYGACAIDATPTRPLCNHNDPPLDNAHVSSLLIHVCRTSSFFFRQHNTNELHKKGSHIIGNSITGKSFSRNEGNVINLNTYSHMTSDFWVGR